MNLKKLAVADMNLIELIKAVPENKLREQFTHRVNEWKLDETLVESLGLVIEKWNAEVWFQNQESQEEFYGHYLDFKHEAIDRISELTVEVRLSKFDLFDEWDKANEEDHLRILEKVHAQRHNIPYRH